MRAFATDEQFPRTRGIGQQVGVFSEFLILQQALDQFLSGVLVLFVELQIHRQQHSTFNVQEIGSHFIKLSKIAQFHERFLFQEGKELVGYGTDGNVINIDFTLLNQKEQKVQRTIKDGGMKCLPTPGILFLIILIQHCHHPCNEYTQAGAP
ncbi:hypothetical protein SDC9_47380 [bioreactor metagenome]|uniref:Uncharacterized protein n=1 Tax=bioreactor metagenome TaxID=1076179 RepID=A0A644WBM2_9ZZZZ